MLSSLPWAALLVDSAGRTQAANAAACRLLDHAVEMLSDMNIALLAPAHATTIAGALTRAVQTGTATCTISVPAGSGNYAICCSLDRCDDFSGAVAIALFEDAAGAFVQRFSAAAADCLDLQQVAQLVEALEPVCGAFGIQPLLAIADRATGSLHWTARPALDLPLPSLPLLQQQADHAPRFAEATHDQPAHLVDSAQPLRTWQHGYVTLPLVARGQRQGVLVLAGPGIRAVNVEALHPLCYLLGTALAHALDGDRAAMPSERMVLLWQAGQALSAVTQIDDVLRVSCEQAQLLTSATTAAILLLEDDREHLRCVMAVGAYSDLLLGHRASVQASIGGRALQQRGSIVVGTIDDHAELDPLVKQLTQLRSGVYQVLRFRGRQIGVLAVGHEQEHFFNEPHSLTLAQWSTNAAVAIENAHLHDAVRRSEERYRTLFQNALEMVLTLDLHGRILSLNRAALRFFGFSPAERHSGTTLHDLLLPETAAHVLSLCSAVLEDESVPPTEVVLHRSDGSRAFVEITLQLLEEHGQTSGVYIIGRDVTERYRQRRALSDRIDQLSALHTLSTAVNSSLDREQMLQAAVEAISLANQFACVGLYVPGVGQQLLRLVVSTGLDDVIHAHIAEAYPGSITWNVLQTGTMEMVHTADLKPELQSLFQAKGTMWHVFVPIMTSSAVLGVLAIGRANDAAFNAGETQVLQTIAAQIAQALEKINLYDAVQLSASRYRDLYENANDFIGTLATDGRVLSLNRAAIQFFGYTPDEVADLHLRDLLPADSDQIVAGVLSSLQNGNAAAMDNLHVVRRDGTAALLELRSRLVYEDQMPTAIHFIARDITERKQLESQVRQAEKLAALGQLVAGAAHELNNPLAVVLGTAQLLLRDPLIAPFAEDIVNIEQSAQRARHIVKQLLTFARKQDHERTSIHFTDLIDRVILTLDEYLQRAEISVVKRVPHNLPPVWGDMYQLEQVFDNLLHNAIHALRESPRQPRTIVIEAVRQQNHVRIRVADNGPGIPPDTLPRIFDPFFTTKEVGHGTGLGLSIVYGIVEQHEGIIHVESVVGNGATFVLDLPVSRDAAEPASPAIVDQPTNSTILVVEDEADVRMIVQRALKQHGYAVDAVDSARAAIQRLADHSYDLIISDLRMPDVSGIELFECVKPIQPQLSWVFITGDTMSQASAGFLSNTGVPVLQKPFSLEELWDAVATSMLHKQLPHGEAA